MKVLQALSVFCLLATNTPVLAHPQPVADISTTQRREAAPEAEKLFAPASDLWKRKGGGGGGGKGGGSSGGSSGSGKGGSSGGSSGGSTGSSGSGATGRGSAGSNAGGATRTGSGPRPAFGGKYGGGARTPYTSGGRSPAGIAPVFLGVGLLSVYPGLWLYGAYSYPYGHPYSFRNRTGRRNSTDTSTTTPTRDINFAELVSRQDDGSGVDETKPVTCLCAQYSVCGCDDDGNDDFLSSLVGDGDYFKLNQSLITVADVNGTSTILLNGTLPNGTTASGGTEEATSSGATDGNDGSTSENTNAAVRTVIEAGGYWVMIAAVGLTCFVI